jgi:hypothetical protein
MDYIIALRCLRRPNEICGIRLRENSFVLCNTCVKVLQEHLNGGQGLVYALMLDEISILAPEMQRVSQW